MIAPGIAGRVLACDFAAALTVRSGSPPWMRLHAQAASCQRNAQTRPTLAV